jgi:hypothetical protein
METGYGPSTASRGCEAAAKRRNKVASGKVERSETAASGKELKKSSEPCKGGIILHQR